MSAGDDFPLDISYSEIGRWLCSRRKLASDWMRRLRDVQQQAQKAFNQLPVGFASQFDCGTEQTVEYPTAKMIRDKLSETSERGYFGGLSGEAGVWDKIVRSYEKGNLYLGEAGQRILKTVNYEIPFMKRRKDMLNRRAMELARKKSECENSAATAAAAFAKECSELGIEGRHLKAEILSLSDKVYDVLRAPFDDLKTESIRSAVEFYRSLNAQLHEVGGDALPVLQCVLDDAIEPPTSGLIKDIRHHETGPVAPEPMGAVETADEALEINWDVDVIDDTLSTEQATEIEAKEDDDVIDWEIELETAGTTEKDSGFLVKPSASPEHVAEGQSEKEMKSVQDVAPDILRFVWDCAFRNSLLDDLYELQSFLLVRNAADASDTVSLTFADVFHKFDQTKVAAFLCSLNGILYSLTGEMAQRYLMLKTSENFADRLMADVQKKAHREQEWRKLAMQADIERKYVQTDRSRFAIKIGQLAHQTKDLKDLVEQGISPLFNNRKINVMGRINTVVNQS